MKRRIVLATAVILIAAGFIIRNMLTKTAEQKRLSEYQLVVKSYADALAPGTSRTKVEALIQSRNQTFTHTCCVGAKRNAWADVVKLGERKSPKLKWPCDRTNLYIAFEFVEESPRSELKASDDDKLISVSLFEQPQPCL